MIWFIVMHLFSVLIDWVRLGQLTEQEKDLEILLLRQQLGIAQRKLNKPVRSARIERLTVAVATTKLKSATGRTALELREVIRIFQPETVLRWHRQLARRKWTHNPDGRRGRPTIDPALERLIARFAGVNRDWGYAKIRGELRKLGYTIVPGTIARILITHNGHYSSVQASKSANQKSPLHPADFLDRTLFVLSGDDGSRPLTCTSLVFFIPRSATKISTLCNVRCTTHDMTHNNFAQLAA